MTSAFRFPSLRSWVRHLDKHDHVAFAKPGVGLKHDLAAIAKRLDGNKATLFPHPGGHEMPVVSGVVGRREWIADALGVAPADLLDQIMDASNNPMPSAEVTDAPVQTEISRDIDLLSQLPIPTHAEEDSGPYISAGLLIARNPDTGAQNVSINRLQASGPDKLGVLILPRHAHHYLEPVEARGDDLPIAIVIGVDPITLLASQAIAPLDQDELEIAGALHGRPLEVIKCVTSDVRVPAHAEIVLEGRVLAGVREPEGPFGEFPKYYGTRSNKHVIQIDAITMRRNPLYHTILGGGLEHLLLGSIPREATILAHLRRTFTSVRDVHLSLGGVGRYHLYVKIDKRQRGEAKNIIMGGFSAHYDIKHVIVVDDDVDVHDPEMVEWALATRFQADRDLVLIENAQGSKLDPSNDDGFGAKMGMDATKPMGADPFTFLLTHIPGEDTVDLNEVISDDRPGIAALDDN
jgi:2,5-furandicarboxylate decarboxylase 1